MSNKDALDYFLHAGYRKMMLCLLKQTAADLMLTPGIKKNDETIEAARNWVLFSPEESSAAGLTFQDCISTLGEASFCNRYRDGFLMRPQDAFTAASQALDAINASEGLFVEAKESRRPELLTTGQFDASWLYATQRHAARAVGG